MTTFKISLPAINDVKEFVNTVMKFDFDIDLVNGFDSDNDGTGDTYFNDGTSDITGWESGKRYTYTITFGKYKILFTPAVDPWKEGGNSSEDM